MRIPGGFIPPSPQQPPTKGTETKTDKQAPDAKAGGAPANPPGNPWTFDDLGDVLRGGAPDALPLLGEFKAVTAGTGGTGGTGTAAPVGATPGPTVGAPVLGKFQTERYHKNFAKYGQYEQEHFAKLLTRTGSPAQIDYLMKAVAAGHSLVEVSKFADRIRDKSDEWLRKNLRVSTDDDGGKGLKQQWSCSCGPTTAEIIRAEMDPVYALELRVRNGDITDIGGNYQVAEEQRKVLEGNDGKAVERGKPGGEGMVLDPALDAISKWTGVKYESHSVASVDARKHVPDIEKQARDRGDWTGVTTAIVGGMSSDNVRAINQIIDKKADAKLKSAFDKLDADLANGIPGALRITDKKDSGGHFVAVIGTTGTGANKRYIIHDPWDGKTVHVKASDLQRGKVNPAVAGWGEVSNVFTSDK